MQLITLTAITNITDWTKNQMLLEQIFCQTETLARPGRLEVRSRIRLGRSSRLERLIPVSPLSTFLGFV